MTTLEDLQIFARWLEDEDPVIAGAKRFIEHFLLGNFKLCSDMGNLNSFQKNVYEDDSLPQGYTFDMVREATRLAGRYHIVVKDLSNKNREAYGFRLRLKF